MVASEVGDDNREIVNFGDTINTAARLQAMCKESDRDFLATGDLLAAMSLPPEVRAERLGKVMLQGKPTPVEVYGLSRALRHT